MNTRLNEPVTELSGIGEQKSALLEKLGITTIAGLTEYYPRNYIDYTKQTAISETENGEYAVIRASLVRKLKPYIGRVHIYKFVVTDGIDELTCTFFNGDYHYNRIKLDEEYVFYGKVQFVNSNKEMLSPQFIELEQKNQLTPVYRLTQGLSQAVLAKHIKAALKEYNRNVPEETLSKEIMSRFNLVHRKTAINNIHFPATADDRDAAKRRLAFEELLVLQLGMAMIKKQHCLLTGSVMHPAGIKKFYSALPFKPTNAQIKAIEECIGDMTKLVPMNRLLQGDVGSGKTMVAAAVSYFAHLNGYQSVIMAPTEILAKQHYSTLRDFLEPLGVSVTFLTGGQSAKEKREILANIKDGTANVITGTHALIQKDVEFHKLGFSVIDEQHRFGVEQRKGLSGKGNFPHNLVMSATPIPRTLALIIYGDLDVSILDEMPKGRLPIKTYGVNTSYRQRIFNFILKNVAEGRQAYIVCPMISETENFKEKASAIAYYNFLRDTYFKDITLGLLHGRMKQTEKDAVMSEFKNNNIAVLVSTTVIEVGVDVPNATIMVIENAEQFGLSQLHQLRGRVGRGREQSYCILITDSTTAYTKARIDTMAETVNGFEIANADLKLRGPGDFFGSKQHGLPELKIADMSGDVELVEISRILANEISNDDPQLREYPELKKEVERLYGENYGSI